MGTAVAIQGGSLLLGIIGGLIGAIIGAAIWAAVAALFNFQSGWIAIVVGAIVGFSVRLLGRGTTIPLGIVGGVFSLVSCFAGMILAAAILVTNDTTLNTAGLSLTDVLKALLSDMGGTIQGIVQNTSAIGWVIYALAVIEGFAFATGRGMRRRRR